MTFLSHPDDATLQRFVDGTLRATENAATQTHCDACERCAATVRHWRTLSATLSTHTTRAVVQAPAGFADAVMARIAALPAPTREFAPAASRPESGRLQRRFARIAWRPTVAALTVGLTGITAGVALVAGQGSATATTAADAASTLVSLATLARVAITSAHAAAPIVGAGSVAAALLCAPVFFRILRTPALRRARATVTRP